MDLVDERLVDAEDRDERRRHYGACSPLANARLVRDHPDGWWAAVGRYAGSFYLFAFPKTHIAKHSRGRIW